jgi:hypothetical protein
MWFRCGSALGSFDHLIAQQGTQGHRRRGPTADGPVTISETLSGYHHLFHGSHLHIHPRQKLHVRCELNVSGCKDRGCVKVRVSRHVLVIAWPDLRIFGDDDEALGPWVWFCPST